MFLTFQTVQQQHCNCLIKNQHEILISRSSEIVNGITKHIVTVSVQNYYFLENRNLFYVNVYMSADTLGF